MNLSNVLKNIEYKQLYGSSAEVTGISLDTRTLMPGDLFVCIKGISHDSHELISEAVSKGASAVLVERPCGGGYGIPVILVASTRQALAFIAVNFHNDPSASMNLIGVTGTKGKTSVTYFIEAILQASGRKPGVIGTLKAQVCGQPIDIGFATSTTPDTPELLQILAKMSEVGVTDVAMEVSSHALQLHKADGLKFKTGVFTNLTHDHLDFHITMENYLKAKSRLFSLCETGIINLDDKASQSIIQNAKCDILTFGIRSDCDIKGSNITYSLNGITFDARLKDTVLHIELPVPGKFTVYNALAAIGAAVSLNIPYEHIVNGLKTVKAVPGRFQSIPNNKGIGVIVDYAHSPDSLVNILSSVRELTNGSVITVFGCGGDRDRLKRSVMGRLAGSLSDYCVITSDNPRSEEPAAIISAIEKGMKETDCEYTIHEDRKEAIFEAISKARPGDMVVIAGKGHENYQELKDKTIHFDDAETAREALKN